MTEKERFKAIKSLILSYESGKLSIKLAIDHINEIATSEVDEFCLNTYWSSEDIDSFVGVLSVSPIENWVDITDIDAKKLINEMLVSFSDSALLLKNSEALEKRFKKARGTVIDLIRQLGMNNTAEEILVRLKIDTVINL